MYSKLCLAHKIKMKGNPYTSLNVDEVQQTSSLSLRECLTKKDKNVQLQSNYTVVQQAVEGRAALSPSCTGTVKHRKLLRKICFSLLYRNTSVTGMTFNISPAKAYLCSLVPKSLIVLSTIKAAVVIHLPISKRANFWS